MHWWFALVLFPLEVCWMPPWLAQQQMWPCATRCAPLARRVRRMGAPGTGHRKRCEVGIKYSPVHIIIYYLYQYNIYIYNIQLYQLIYTYMCCEYMLHIYIDIQTCVMNICCTYIYRYRYTNVCCEYMLNIYIFIYTDRGGRERERPCMMI